jgi:hypothetical protein
MLSLVNDPWTLNANELCSSKIRFILPKPATAQHPLVAFWLSAHRIFASRNGIGTKNINTYLIEPLTQKVHLRRQQQDLKPIARREKKYFGRGAGQEIEHLPP